MTAHEKDRETETSRLASSGHYHGRARAVSTVTGKRNMLPKSPHLPGERIARRQGGLKGGKARAEKLSPERRREIALKTTTKARWSKVSSKGMESDPIPADPRRSGVRR